MTIRFLGVAGLAAAAVVLGVGSAWAGEQPALREAARAVENANDAVLRYEGKRMRYEQARFGGDARLYVREDVATDARNGSETPDLGRWRVYRGRDLDVITKANADLAANAEMGALRTYVETNSRVTALPARYTGTIRTSVEDPNFVYEPTYMGSSRLYVRNAEGRETLYTGSNFDTIVRANPSFEQLAGFPSFRSRVQLIETTSPWVLRNDSSTLLNVRHTPTGVIVATNDWRDGRWVSHSHEGKTLAEIQANQAEVRALLANREGTLPTTVPATKRNSGWNAQVFGVSMATPPPCLDSQMKLSGRGLLVTDVRDGSAASTLGLQNHDVIVEYDGRAVTEGDSIRTQFDAWRADTRTKVVVVRHGSRVTLGS